MGNLIKDGKLLVDDDWMPYTGLEDTTNLPDGNIFVPLEEWESSREGLLARNSRLGVFMKNTQHWHRLRTSTTTG